MIVFWNYFQHGLDILISPDNVVSKIILHSNIVCHATIHAMDSDIKPGTPAFQTHARCPWTLPTPSGGLDHTSPLSSYKAQFTGEPAKEEISLKVPESNKKKGKKGSPGPSSMNDIGDVLDNAKRVETHNGAGERGESEGMILDRVVEGGLNGVEGMSPSRMSLFTNVSHDRLIIGLVGFKGLILEEDMASGGIASVLVFRQT